MIDSIYINSRKYKKSNMIESKSLIAWAREMWKDTRWKHYKGLKKTFLG